MSKRTRGSVRPGQRPRTARDTAPRTATRPVIDPALASDTTATEAVVDAGATTDTAPGSAVAGRVTSQRTGATRHARARAKPGSLLAARASSEYVYVAQDLRRVAVVTAIVFVAMLVFWIVLVVLGVSPLY